MKKKFFVVSMLAAFLLAAGTVRAQNIDDKIKQVEAVGGKVITPKNKVMDMGWYAKVEDTEGNVVGIWENIK